MPYVQHTLAPRRNVSASHRLQIVGAVIGIFWATVAVTARQSPPEQMATEGTGPESDWPITPAHLRLPTGCDTGAHCGAPELDCGPGRGNKRGASGVSHP